jgi:hypothetical protein
MVWRVFSGLEVVCSINVGGSGGFVGVGGAVGADGYGGVLGWRKAGAPKTCAGTGRDLVVVDLDMFRGGAVSESTFKGL